MTKFYKNHKKEKTAKLHEVFDSRFREDALKFAIEHLGYTKEGALSWFSHWDKTDPKTAATPTPEPAPEPEPTPTPAKRSEQEIKDERNRRRREARAAKKASAAVE